MGVQALEKWHFLDAWLSNVSLADQRHPADAVSTTTYKKNIERSAFLARAPIVPSIAKPFFCDLDLHQ